MFQFIILRFNIYSVNIYFDKLSDSIVLELLNSCSYTCDLYC